LLNTEPKKMKYDNKQTDKKLQELEHQSLPDLSKMDAHWQQMSLLLEPGNSFAPQKGLTMRRTLIMTIAAAILVAATTLFVMNRKTASQFQPGPKAVEAVKIISPSDTPLVNKAALHNDSAVAGKAMTSRVLVARNRLKLERFYEQIQKKSQAFTVNNNRDTIIEGGEGTILTIPANSFEADGTVTVMLTEVYSIEEMIANKLTTTCEGRQLISGGMIYLDAVDKNENLVDLRKGALLRLDMPRARTGARMELFYGEDFYRNDFTTVMDSINWIRTNQAFDRSPSLPGLSRTARGIDQVRKNMDTVWFEDGEGNGRTFDYFLQDTIRKDTPGASAGRRRSDSISIQRFGVNINRLGWINCDRFYQDARPRVELIVDLGDNPDNYNTILVFDNLNSILPRSSAQGNSIRFSNVPAGEPARVVAFGVRNDKTVTAVRKLTLASAVINDLRFEEVNGTTYKAKGILNK
jgi:hypothetical protein